MTSSSDAVASSFSQASTSRSDGGRVLVDTGLTELHPLVADMDPHLTPLATQEGAISTRS
ncbi:hypothetical protein GCM10011512_09220 [Tersicoccus solisilvae]|uniref:FXSXX-COOH protein n=1 Tax=Tersicoccus solisilvae TaxID=1882339 RepID=A0ABQ1P0N7_9MICC|nr:hypothetical protein [Tersicoccus solisilvae]GGC84528.1 hypothetical protein GCM10011512_09220 [Tersicoccus solisilvae]